MFFPLSFGYSACGVGVYVEPVSLLEGVGGGWGALTLLLSYWLPSFWVFQHIFVLLTLMCERKRRIFASLWKNNFFDILLASLLCCCAGLSTSLKDCDIGCIQGRIILIFRDIYSWHNFDIVSHHFSTFSGH